MANDWNQEDPDAELPKLMKSMGLDDDMLEAIVERDRAMRCGALGTSAEPFSREQREVLQLLCEELGQPNALIKTLAVYGERKRKEEEKSKPPMENLTDDLG